MSEGHNTFSESDILEQLVTHDQAGFSPEAARAFLHLRFGPEAIRRMNELAEKNRQGTLTEGERAALEKYLRVGNFINILQAKARLALSDSAPASN
ncbi:MAG: DUF896 domain-containing protein [Gemmataceae bacterium]|nr:DUF896 domain-containing protein [Gemmataceae bacterium]